MDWIFGFRISGLSLRFRVQVSLPAGSSKGTQAPLFAFRNCGLEFREGLGV